MILTESPSFAVKSVCLCIPITDSKGESVQTTSKPFSFFFTLCVSLLCALCLSVPPPHNKYAVHCLALKSQ